MVQGIRSYSQTTVRDGITVHVIRNDRFKAATLVVDFLVPLSEETASEYSLVPALLDCGCVPYPSRKKLCAKLEELYSSSITYRSFRRGEWQVVEFAVDVLNNEYILEKIDLYSETMKVFSAMLLQPLMENGVFLPGFVTREKQNLKDSIRDRINHKSTYAVGRCLSVMCEGEPYAIHATGTEITVDAVTPEKLTDAYHRLLSTARIEAFYVGNLSEDTVVPSIKALFSSVPRSYVPFVLPESRRLVSNVRHVTENVNAKQGKLVMGFRLGTFLGESDYREMPLLLELLSDSPTSKLFMNVREKRSLCYTCSASVDGIKGIMLIRSGIDNDKCEEVQSAIQEQLQDIRDGKISEEEWRFAIRSLQNAYRSLSDSSYALCGWYLTCVFSGRVRTPEEMALEVPKVTRGQVSRAASRIMLDTCFFLKGMMQAGEEAADDDDE